MMTTRSLGSDGLRVTQVGLGCWQLGGGWGKPWSDAVAQEILAASYDAGLRFFDTADVYGDGESERSIGRFLQTHRDVTVATKLGRWAIYPDGYTRQALRDATLRSLERLGVDRLDLTQLHCVPMAVMQRGEVFEWLRELQQEGLIARFGASVETVEEGLVCLEQEGLTSLQVIFNVFRQKPLDELFPQAKNKGVGIIVRLPLASGLLSGMMSAKSQFTDQDHRHFNRNGEAFNVGETFAGLQFEAGLELVEEIRALVPAGTSMAQMALRWVLDHDAVSVVIPGASSADQARANASADAMQALAPELHRRLSALYVEHIHALIRGPY